MDVINIATGTHGRVLLEPAARPSGTTGLLVAFHGYGQSAEEMLAEIARINGIGAWRVASVQGLHRFYARRDERIVASWMTRQDRELAMADNIAYVDSVVDKVWTEHETAPLVFVGFSQGAAMAYRAARRGRHEASGLIALGGDLPPELKENDGRAWPAVMIGSGAQDPWYTPAKCDADEAALRAAGAPLDVIRFEGGHEWTDAFRAAASRWLAQRLTTHDQTGRRA
jgi:predicted esterase